MKFIRIILCLFTGITNPSIVDGQQVVPVAGQQSASLVTVSKLEWNYPSSGVPAAAHIAITNNSKRTVKAVRLLVIAKDKKGTILQSQGTTIKRLVHTDTIAPGDTKSLYFKRAFDNPGIATLELKNATVEYTNGALEQISD